MAAHPASTPHRTGFLDTDDGQHLYWEESGDPSGLPTLYLHGGPGGGLGEGYRSRYDPSRYRIIGLDQRGCGRSTPLAEQALDRIDDNTTGHLVRDLEALRVHLGVDRWQLTGVSWGSTLALAYAQAFPERVHSIILVAVTSTSTAEVEWVTESMRSIYPEHWDEFAGHAQRAGVGYQPRVGRVVDAYADLLRSADPAVRAAAATAWCRWEDVHVSLGAGLAPAASHSTRYDDAAFRERFALLVTHYWSNSGFGGDEILGRMHRIGHIPAVLIHGRADVSSPLVTAWQLHRAWPASRLHVVEAEGHGGAGMTELWVTAADDLAHG